MRIYCIINPRAGGWAAVSDSLGPLFASRGIFPDFVYPEQGSSITEIAAGAVRQGYDVVVAGGGDGTVNGVASALVATGVRLGVLPLGTLNHFAKDQKIPLEIDLAVETIISGKVKSIDVAEVNDRRFVNNSSLGLYPPVVRLRDALRKSGYGKWPAFARAALVALARFPRLSIELHADSGVHAHCVTAILFVGNNKYEITLTQLGARKTLDEGKLWVMVSTAPSRFHLLLAFLSLIRGRDKTGHVSTFEARNLVVNAKAAQVAVTVDGEVCLLRPPLNYRSLPKSVQVIVPATE